MKTEVKSIVFNESGLLTVCYKFAGVTNEIWERYGIGINGNGEEYIYS